MVPAWTVTLTYVGYAAMLAIAAACWGLILFEYIAQLRFDGGLLDKSGRDAARHLANHAQAALYLGLACGGLAFLLALLPAGEAAPLAQSHKAYQLRAIAILLLVLGIVRVTFGRMGAFDVDIVSVLVFAWAAWVVVSGWLAFAGGAAVSGPGGWWAALAVDVLVAAALAALLILLKPGDIRVMM